MRCEIWGPGTGRRVCAELSSPPRLSERGRRGGKKATWCFTTNTTQEQLEFGSGQQREKKKSIEEKKKMHACMRALFQRLRMVFTTLGCSRVNRRLQTKTISCFFPRETMRHYYYAALLLPDKCHIHQVYHA